MKKLLLITAFVFWVSHVFSAVYYVDNSYGSDTNSGLSPSLPWKTLTKVNSVNFAPGDEVLFKRGEKWRGVLAPASNGTLSAPIVFGAYGSGSDPVITAAQEMNGPWTSLSNNRWSMPLTVETKTVSFNGAQRGIRAVTAAQVNAPNEFYWGSGKLYIYATAHPDTYYGEIEAGQGTFCVTSNDKDYLMFRELAVYGGQGTDQTTSPGGGIFISPGSHHVTVQNCHAYLCQGAGIRVHAADDVTISGNEINDIDSHDVQTSGDGIAVTWDPDNNTDIPVNLLIAGNTISQYIDRQGIAVINGSNVVISGNYVYAGRSGIDIEPNDGSSNKVINALIENNTIDKYHNEPSSTGGEEGTNGIAVSGEISYNVTIRNNQINMQNHPDAIGISVTDWGTLLGAYPGGGIFALIEGNNITNTHWGVRVGDHYSSQVVQINRNFISISVADAGNNSRGIYLKFKAKAQVTNNVMYGPYSYLLYAINESQCWAYHNVFYNYIYRGLYTRDLAQLTAKNNILYSVNPQLTYHVMKNGAAMTLDRNIYYPSGSYYRWGSTTRNMATLRSVAGQEINGMEANPMFENTSGSFASAQDFKLSATSPAIDAAEEVGVTTDFNGAARFDHPGYPNTGSSFADRGAFEYNAGGEICNGVDDDGDGQIDEGVTMTFFRDADNDGYGNAYTTIQSCSAPAGYVSNNLDCNDGNAAINPNANEVPNGMDDNCNNMIDEPGLSLSFQVTHIACSGGLSTGAINLSVSIANAATYLWSNGSTAQNITGVAAGTYTVTVTSGGMVVTGSATVNPRLTVTTTGSNIACYGYNTGSVTALAVGGTPPYSYSWSNGSTASSISGLGAAVYRVTVTDGLGCAKTSSYTVSQPSSGMSISSSLTQVVCFGQNSGVANISVSAAVSPVSYQWSDGATSEDRSGLYAGTYTVTATGATGCTASKVCIITQPATPLVITNVSQQLLSTGLYKLTVTATGGTPPYKYKKLTATTFQLSNIYSNVSPGTYEVVVRDANLCTASVTVSVPAPAGLMNNGGNLQTDMEHSVLERAVAFSGEGDVMPIIYPNPASLKAVISLPEGYSQQGVLRCLDITGKLIQEERIIADQKDYELNTSHWDNGVYLIQLISGGQVATARLVVNRP